MDKTPPVTDALKHQQPTQQSSVEAADRSAFAAEQSARYMRWSVVLAVLAAMGSMVSAGASAVSAYYAYKTALLTQSDDELRSETFEISGPAFKAQRK
jgi:hypothetical protein